MPRFFFSNCLAPRRSFDAYYWWPFASICAVWLLLRVFLCFWRLLAIFEDSWRCPGILTQSLSCQRLPKCCPSCNPLVCVDPFSSPRPVSRPAFHHTSESRLFLVHDRSPLVSLYYIILLHPMTAPAISFFAIRFFLAPLEFVDSYANCRKIGSGCSEVNWIFVQMFWFYVS